MDARYREFVDARAATATASTLATYRCELRMIEAATDKCVVDMTKAEIRAFAAKLAKRRSGYLLAALARMVLRFHDREDLAKYLKVRKPRGRLDPRKILDIADVNAMLRACTTKRDAALVAVLWETGGRIHEIMALRLDNVVGLSNGERDLLKVFIHKTKVRGEEHSVLLIESVAHLNSWIASYPFPKREGAPLFPSLEVSRRGQPLTENAARRIIHQIAERAGIKKPANPHAFRHGRCTSLLRMKIPEAGVKRLMGWSPSSSMLGRYSHLLDRDVDNALLEAHGYKPRADVAIGSLDEPEADLVPVIPLLPPLAPAAAGGVDYRELARVMLEEISSSGRPAPAWSPDVAKIQELTQEVRELRGKLEELAKDRG